MSLFDIFRKKSNPSEEEKQSAMEEKKQEIHQKAGRHTVEEIRDEILRKTEIPCMNIELVDTEPSIFDSKAGGIGYIPRDGAAPVDSEGNQLRLLAQIDCSEITLEDFPHRGLLQFWILCDDSYGLIFEGDPRTNTYQVLYYPEVDRSVTAEEVQAKLAPMEEEVDFPVSGCFGLKLTEETDHISSTDYRFAERISALVKEQYPEEADDLLDDPFEFVSEDDAAGDGFGHKIGGYPGFTQYDPREGGDEAYDVLLFQMDSDYEDGGDKVMWGDSGICNFFISREKLKRCDFNDVCYNWDCY